MAGLWIPMTVIIIFLVVWIISNVIRAQQDANQAAVRRNNAANRQAAAPARGDNRGNSDIDRFLQEIDRLRKKGQQEKAQQQDETAAPPPPPKPRPVAERRPEPSRGRSSGAPRPQREARPATPTPPSSSRAPAPIVPELIAAPTSSGSTTKPGSLASTIEAKAETARVAAEVAAKAAPGSAAKSVRQSRASQAGAVAAVSPTLLLVQKLFQTQQGAAAAVLLHEIFGPPRSRKA